MDLKYEDFKITFNAKVTADTDHFLDQRLLLDYLHSRLKEYAAEIILSCFCISSFNYYTSLKEAFADLNKAFINPAYIEIAIEDFCTLCMQCGKIFASFKLRFLMLTSKFKAPQVSLVNKLYNKLNKKLKNALALFKHKWSTSFSTATAKI